MIRIGYLQSTSTLQSGEQRFRVAPEFGMDGGIAGPVFLGALSHHCGSDDDVAVEGGEDVDAGGGPARHGHHKTPDEVLAGGRLVHEVLTLAYNKHDQDLMLKFIYRCELDL